MIIAIVGAGDLGGALASTLAARGRVDEIRLIDEAGTSAEGKALDIQQSTPVHGTAVRLAGSATLATVDGADLVVLADAFGPSSREWQGEAGLALLRRLLARVARVPVVLAGASHAWLLERAVAELGVDWTRAVGSAPGALVAAVRGIAALEADASPLDVHVGVTGLPPHHTVVGWESASIANEPLTARLDVAARARIARRLPFLWPPGPMALGAAAAHLIEAIATASDRSHAAFVALASAGSPLRRAVMAGVRLTPSGIARATLPDLSQQERLALENALQR